MSNVFSKILGWFSQPTAKELPKGGVKADQSAAGIFAQHLKSAGKPETEAPQTLGQLANLRTRESSLKGTGLTVTVTIPEEAYERKAEEKAKKTEDSKPAGGQRRSVKGSTQKDQQAMDQKPDETLLAQVVSNRPAQNRLEREPVENPKHLSGGRQHEATASSDSNPLKTDRFDQQIAVEKPSLQTEKGGVTKTLVKPAPQYPQSDLPLQDKGAKPSDLPVRSIKPLTPSGSEKKDVTGSEPAHHNELQPNGLQSGQQSPVSLVQQHPFNKPNSEFQKSGEQVILPKEPAIYPLKATALGSDKTNSESSAPDTFEINSSPVFTRSGKVAETGSTVSASQTKETYGNGIAQVHTTLASPVPVQELKKLDGKGSGPVQKQAPGEETGKETGRNPMSPVSDKVVEKAVLSAKTADINEGRTSHAVKVSQVVNEKRALDEPVASLHTGTQKAVENGPDRPATVNPVPTAQSGGVKSDSVTTKNPERPSIETPVRNSSAAAIAQPSTTVKPPVTVNDNAPAAKITDRSSSMKPAAVAQPVAVKPEPGSSKNQASASIETPVPKATAAEKLQPSATAKPAASVPENAPVPKNSESQAAAKSTAVAQPVAIKPESVSAKNAEPASVETPVPKATAAEKLQSSATAKPAATVVTENAPVAKNSERFAAATSATEAQPVAVKPESPSAKNAAPASIEISIPKAAAPEKLQPSATAKPAASVVENAPVAKISESQAAARPGTVAPPVPAQPGLISPQNPASAPVNLPVQKATAEKAQPVAPEKTASFIAENAPLTKYSERSAAATPTKVAQPVAVKQEPVSSTNPAQASIETPVQKAQPSATVKPAASVIAEIAPVPTNIERPAATSAKVAQPVPVNPQPVSSINQATTSVESTVQKANPNAPVKPAAPVIAENAPVPKNFERPAAATSATVVQPVPVNPQPVSSKNQAPTSVESTVQKAQPSAVVKPAASVIAENAPVPKNIERSDVAAPATIASPVAAKQELVSPKNPPPTSIDSRVQNAQPSAVVKPAASIADNAPLSKSAEGAAPSNPVVVEKPVSIATDAIPLRQPEHSDTASTVSAMPVQSAPGSYPTLNGADESSVISVSQPTKPAEPGRVDLVSANAPQQSAAVDQPGASGRLDVPHIHINQRNTRADLPSGEPAVSQASPDREAVPVKAQPLNAAFSVENVAVSPPAPAPAPVPAAPDVRPAQQVLSIQDPLATAVVVQAETVTAPVPSKKNLERKSTAENVRSLRENAISDLESVPSGINEKPLTETALREVEQASATEFQEKLERELETVFQTKPDVSPDLLQTRGTETNLPQRGMLFQERITELVKNLVQTPRQPDLQGWNRQRVVFDDGQQLSVSVRKNGERMEIQIAAGSPEMRALIQPHMDEIKQHLQDQFGTQIDLSMQQENRQEKPQQDTTPRPASNERLSLRGLNDLPAKPAPSERQAPVERRFGFNKKEWTA
jgi:hypothetical protein